MRQTTMAEVRLDHGKVAGTVPAKADRRAILAVSGSAKIEFRCDGLLGAGKITSNGPGSRRMSVKKALPEPHKSRINYIRDWNIFQKGERRWPFT